MIRTSAAIAAIALCLSLLVHFVGVDVTFRKLPEKSHGPAQTEVVAMGNAFEDIVETVTDPVRPEPAPTPEPPAETVPEPERAEIPVSEALVASDNPQNVSAPDTGAAQVVQPETSGSSAPELNEAPERTTIEPSGGEENAVSDARMTPPVKADTATEAPGASAAGRPVPIEPAPAPPAPTTPTEPRQLAALPAPPAAPVPPVAPAPSAAQVIPLEPETVVPDTSENPDDPSPQTPESAETEDDASELAVTSSLRPQLPVRRPSPEPEGADRLSATGLAPSQLIESPLTAYQRDGTNMFAGQSGGAQSGRMGLMSSRGPGNSDVTNYAGQVLVHLNRVAPVAVAARGWARVFFQINPDGTLAWVEIIDGTGSQEIDRAAKEQVRSADPFPRPPDGKSRKLSFFYQIK